MNARPPVTALVIFDGWGLLADRAANAVALSRTPTMDRFYASYAHTELQASGEAVGLLPGVMGNSEVGHLTIGSGRAIYQDVMRISRAIGDGSFFRNPALEEAMRSAAQGANSQATLHLWGLLSDASVHSHIDHLFALLDMAARSGAASIAVHAALDGRDTPPRSALGYVDKLEAKLKKLGRGRIATVSGRYFAMDRDRRWERTEQAWRAVCLGQAPSLPTARAAVEASYAADRGDEFVEPRVIGAPAPIADGDQIICYNFRADRARQLTAALALNDFSGFKRERFPQVGYVCMTEYDQSFGLPLAFGPEQVRNTLAEVFGRNQIRNLRIAETEKYAHVTYFFNGGVEQPFPGEERILIPSSKVATYDLEPEMRAAAVAERAAQEIESGRFDVVIVNFANPDMVGHSGNLEATVTAVETSDQALGHLAAVIEPKGGIMLVTSDHGNAEFMKNPATGQPHTAHTTNPVPFVLADRSYHGRLRSHGTLADIAPTMLAILDLAVPPEMTGRDLRKAG